MNYYSFEHLNKKDSIRYNLFDKTLVPDKIKNLRYQTIDVPERFKGRMDLLCKYLHGSEEYIEELMAFNNIINIHSLKPETEIKYLPDGNDYALMYDSDPEKDDKKDEILGMNKQKETKKDSNRIGSPPTIKPDGLKQLDINYNRKTISIINKFK